MRRRELRPQPAGLSGICMMAALAQARRGAGWVAAILLGALTASCGAAREARVIAVPLPGVQPASHILRIRDYRVALATVAALVEEETGTARFPVAFRFFPDREQLAAALVAAGYNPAAARATAREMAAVGGHRQVLLNEGSVSQLPWPGRVALLAHELTHGLQYELGGGRRGAADQWLREGFADWVAMRVLDRLRVLPAHEFRRVKIEQYRAFGARLSLDRMATFPEWVELSARTGGRVYLRAFLAADFAIERHGLRAAIDYFSRFARSDDRLGNFRAAFGESREAFESALDARLRRP